VNKAIFRKGIIVVIVIATIIAAWGLGTYISRAADRVDVAGTIKITAAVADGDDSIFANAFNGTVEIELYKLAAMDYTGRLTKVGAFADETVKIDILDGNPSIDDIKTGIVNPALTIAARDDVVADEVIRLNKAEATEASVEIEGGAGLYLYIPKDVRDLRYAYSFTSYVIMAPTSEFIMTGAGSDEWNPNVTFNLKCEETPLYGSLRIIKNLDTYNLSLGKAAFVYEVKAVRDQEVVFNNVFSIDFSSPGQLTREIEDIPADADVTVTEIYTGASYTPVGDRAVDVRIVADTTVDAAFENDFDERLNQGGISAENHFDIIDGVYYWTDKDGNPVAQGQTPNEAAPAQEQLVR